MDHARALGNTADGAGLSADFKRNSDFLFDGVRRHDAFCRSVAVITESLSERFHAVCDGGNVQRLTDDTRGSNDHVFSGNTKLRRNEAAHFFCNFYAVCIAGIGVAAVTDHSLCLSVLQMLFGNGQGRALDQVRRIYCRRTCLNLTVDQRKVFFRFVFADTAMNTACTEALCGTYAACRYFHDFIYPFVKSTHLIFVFYHICFQNGSLFFKNLF